MVTVRVPTVLRSLTGGSATLSVAGSTVREVLGAMVEAHPGLGERLFEAPGRVRRFINVFVDDEDIRHADGLDTTVREGQTVSILPAVAGGAGPQVADGSRMSRDPK